MLFQRFPCAPLAQSAYLLADGDEAIVVDPLRDASAVLAFASERRLTIRHVVATHVHADFVAGLHEVAAATGARIAMGERFGGPFACDRLADGAELRIGDATVRVLATPGHTVESVCLLATARDPAVPQRLLSGDTLFVGDVGRPDLAQGAGQSPREMAAMLHKSLHERLAPLADATEVWPAHGAGSACGGNIGGGPCSSIGDERRQNWALREGDPERFAAQLLGALQPPPRYFAAVAAQNRAGPRLLASLPPLRELTVAAALAERRGGAHVLDVRSRFEHGEAHWPGSTNLSLQGNFEPWAGVLLPLAQPLVLHAANEADARAAALRLHGIGFDALAGFVLALPDDAARLPQIESTDLFTTGLPHHWQVIDVRRPDEYSKGHVQGAVHCELGAEMQVARLAALDRAQPTAIVCDRGYRSSAASQQLLAAGFTDLHNVHDGMQGWRTNHLPLV